MTVLTEEMADLMTVSLQVKAMRFPPKSYNKELESAEDRREREAQVLIQLLLASYFLSSSLPPLFLAPLLPCLPASLPPAPCLLCRTWSWPRKWPRMMTMPTRSFIEISGTLVECWK
jgi:hypothetical protein